MTKNKWLLEDLASPLANRPITKIKPESSMLLQKIERRGTGDGTPPAGSDR